VIDELGDDRAASPLLERALELTRPVRLDVHLELDLAEARGVPREQAAIAEQAAEWACEAGDEVGEALAFVVAAHARLRFADDPAADEVTRLARAALPLLEVELGPVRLLLAPVTEQGFDASDAALDSTFPKMRSTSALRPL
jgi:hypothetical protein